jgi:hypothetical protein
LLPPETLWSPVYMGQIPSQPTSRTAKESWWRDTEPRMNCQSLKSIADLRLPWKWLITGGDSLPKWGDELGPKQSQ